MVVVLSSEVGGHSWILLAFCKERRHGPRVLVSHWIVSRALGSDEDGTHRASSCPARLLGPGEPCAQKLQLTRGLLPETLRRRSSTALASVVSMQGVAMVSLPSCTTLNALDI